ncbi:MAG: NYN domain-containing protein [Actinobacteria bacterium]|nr:NYN domain-containing protein [Actinomycetota bacterium]
MFNNYAFIDGQNLFTSINKYNYQFSYEIFYNFLKNKLYVTKAFYFIGLTENRNHYRYKKLRKIGFILSLKKPAYRFKNDKMEIKANVDTNLVAHSLIKINQYDKAVIVAGDGDYYFLAKYLLRNDKLHKLLFPCKSDTSNLFKSGIFKNKIIYLSRVRDSCIKNNRQAL